MAGVNRHYREIKTALRKKPMPDPYFTGKYSFSPYMACEHACKYCDGRAERYYVEGDYEKDIVIRSNLPVILEKELQRVKEIGPVSVGSGISDPYQPVERQEKLMQQCGKLLLKAELPAVILTKSALVKRDLDIWSKLNSKKGVLLMISITTLNDEIRTIFEPGASSVEERLDAIVSFKKAGISVGALLMPFLPGITDDPKDIEALIIKLKSLGIDFILPGGLTLRPGRQKALYLALIEDQYPHLMELYNRMYDNELPSGSPERHFSKELFHNLNSLLNKHEIPDQIPHYVYKGRFTSYDEVYILLNHMIKLYNDAGVETRALKMAYKRYCEWIKEERKIYLRKRKKSQNQMELNFINLLENNMLKQIIKNIKLSDFLKKVILEGKTFDYNDLKLY